MHEKEVRFKQVRAGEEMPPEILYLVAMSLKTAATRDYERLGAVDRLLSRWRFNNVISWLDDLIDQSRESFDSIFDDREERPLSEPCPNCGAPAGQPCRPTKDDRINGFTI